MAAIKSNKPIERGALTEALRPDPRELDRPPPVYQSENQTARLRALKAKLDALAELGRAAIGYERNRKPKDEK